MSLSRRSRSSARLLNAQEHEDDRNKNNERPDIMQTQSNTSAGKLQSSSPNKQMKRERPSSESFSSAKSLKIEPCVLTSDVKTESRSAADRERHKRYQSSVEEVYLHGSYAESDCAQNDSPRTPILSHSDAQHVNRFMESFAAAFPSESEDLMVLLDAFIERR